MNITNDGYRNRHKVMPRYSEAQLICNHALTACLGY